MCVEIIITSNDFTTRVTKLYKSKQISNNHFKNKFLIMIILNNN